VGAQVERAAEGQGRGEEDEEGDGEGAGGGTGDHRDEAENDEGVVGGMARLGRRADAVVRADRFMCHTQLVDTVAPLL
jgi:hypothetical protein